MKIVAFAGSTSKTSINKQLVTYASSLLEQEVTILDINDFETPLYSVDLEKEIEYPSGAEKFNQELENADAFIISLAEHNGSFAVAYKNLFDWVSRKESKVFRGKPLLIMATSPGGRGGASVLNLATTIYPHMGANVTSQFSLPSFFDNFKDGKITNEELNTTLKKAVSAFQEAL